MIKSRQSQWRQFFVSLALVFLFCSNSFALDASGLFLQEEWRTVLADQDVVLHLRTDISGVPAQTGAWQLSANNRTLAQGTFAISQVPPDGRLAEIRFHVPPVAPGVMIAADLNIRLPVNNSDHKTTLTEKFFIFSADPFFDKKEWLAQHKIGLYDPNEKTGNALEKIGLPFEAVSNIDAIPAFQGALFIVGQGVDFEQYPAVWGQVLALADQGIPVLIMAPQGGTFRVPQGEAGMRRQQENMTLSREKVVREFDKNLDTHWAPEGRTSIAGFRIALLDGELAFVTEPSANVWPWLDITFMHKGGRVIVCGFDFTGTMEYSPTPRYFLARLIEKLIQP